MTPPDFLRQFWQARQVGTPLVGIQTPDPQSSIERLMAPVPDGKGGYTRTIPESTPVLVWDAVRGIRHLNKAGEKVLLGTYTLLPGEVDFRTKLPKGTDLAGATSHPVDALVLAQFFPKPTVLFMMNGHRFLGEGGTAGASVVQAVWNLRDAYKANLRTLVILGPSFVLPSELANDVTILDEPLPRDNDLEQIAVAVLETAVAAGRAGSAKEDVTKIPRAVDALRGLSAFAAEQAMALAIDKNGLDLDQLWDRKKRLISSTPGLGIWRGGETFSEIGGCDQAKKFARMIINGRRPFNLVLFMDEVEKQMAGAAGHDNTGIAQRQEQQFLTWAEDSGATGLTFVGPPGCCKSQMAKAIGAEAGVPVVQFDFGAMMNSYAGASEERTRTAFKVVDAVGGGRVLMVGTCNSTGALSGAFRRRFKMGTFYFDLLTDAERPKVWEIFFRRFELKKQTLPDDRGWTGAEIKQACLLAYELNIPLVETAQFITPVCRTMASEIDTLRDEAEGKYLSAAHPGFYHRPATESTTTLATRVRRARATEEV